jgi:D-alanyl-D-alanine dipeptidase
LNDYFEAVSIYQDIAVNLQYAEMKNETHEQIFKAIIRKYGKPKIAEAIHVLCKDLDEKRKHYTLLPKIISMTEVE